MSKELERLGKYEMQERLGKGGMGEVWKARDTQLRRYVAIKFLNANLQDNPNFVTHFTREAQFVASLHHPNIVQIHDFQLTNTRGSGITAYMVMDYIEGGTLADYIHNTSRKGLFPPAADIVYIFTMISLALDYAHQKGMIHRDIKPANILIDKRTTTGKSVGEPMLTDFGIAKLQGAGATTFTLGAIGTPLYISPEQAKGLATDARSDLYSLGIILYEIVTGVTPFRGGSAVAIMMQHLQEMPTPPALINPKISPELSAVVLQSIAKDPEARFSSATAMTVAIAQALKVPVPSSLNRPGVTNEQPDYNPLQPAGLLADMADRVEADRVEADRAEVDRAEANRAEANRAPARGAPTMNGRGLSAPDLSQGMRSPDTTPYGDRPLPEAQPRRRGLYIALIACIILLLVGVSAFSVLPWLYQNNTPNTSGNVVGQIVFVRSPNAPPGTFDQLRIELKNISPPPANKAYYGWLESANSEAAVPHWKLQISNSAVDNVYHDPKYPDLLTPTTTKFLVTEEDASSTPDIPLPDLSAHIYYAVISHTSSASPTFEVKQCPTSGINNAANPCS